ncbi:MAG: alpha-amylase family glycosyl hydrolase [Anaerolineales bacterium]|jgi:glycosidase|nr:alpha-amylase family glycosyl hydrolase [Anaerolineales bacterium]
MTEPIEFLWWKHGVIYQIYPRSFRDSSGNGIGDLQGIIEKLDYVAELGVDAIWVSPCYPSPMADFGYDVSDHCDIHPLFGTLQTMDALLQAAHQRDLCVMLDFVPSHTSEQHQWFQESRASRSNPKRDWYTWRDTGPDGGPPNNWLSIFGGPAWEWDAHTRQYYLHTYLKEQPDLNWRNPAVKEAMFSVVRFWLERGVDGFRVDAAHGFMKDPVLRDNPPNRNNAAIGYESMDAYDSQLHVNDRGHPDIHAVYRELRALLDEYSRARPRFTVGEIHIFDWSKWASYYGANLDEIHMPGNFTLVRIPWRASLVRGKVDELEAALPAGAWPNHVLGNHDEHRIASRYGAAAARTAAMLLLTLRGTPTLYYGDEIGMLNVTVPAEKCQDPWPQRSGKPELSRDPQRSPMQWDARPGAGFSGPAVHGDLPEPWLLFHPEYQRLNVATQRDEPGSMLDLYRCLLRLRRETPALTHGEYRALDDAPPAVYGYLREYGGDRLLVLLNFEGESKQVTSVSFDYGEVLLSTTLDRDGAEGLDPLVLRPHEGVIIRV